MAIEVPGAGAGAGAVMIMIIPVVGVRTLDFFVRLAVRPSLFITKRCGWEEKGRKYG